MKSLRRFYKRRKKINLHNKSLILNWLKNHFAFLILLVIIFLLTFREFKNYYSTISYQLSESIPDSTKEYYSSIRYTLSTKKAFLPYEKIKIEVVYFPSSPEQLNLATHSNSIGVLFDPSEFTKNKINENQFTEYDKNKPKEEQLSYIAPFQTAPPGSIKLRNTTTNRSIYKGSAEVFYTNQGSFEPTLLFTNADWKMTDSTLIRPIITYKQFRLKTKINIDSYTEANTNKNNELLYILTVVNILFIIYSEFFRKK